MLNPSWPRYSILFWLYLSVFPKKYGHVILFPTGIPRTISGPWVISIPYCMPVPCLCNVSPFVLLSFSLDPETDSNSFIIFRHGVIYLWCDRKTFMSSTYWLILTSFSSLMAIPFISGLDLIVSASGSDCIINKSADIAFPLSNSSGDVEIFWQMAISHYCTLWKLVHSFNPCNKTFPKIKLSQYVKHPWPFYSIESLFLVQ